MRRTTVRRIAFAALAVTLSLAAAEGAARVVIHTLGLRPSFLIPDDALKHRLHPGWPEHDAAGFRNPVALASADVVAIGDSQTFGTGVASAESWPAQLERLTGRSVYSMAVPGYGPVQYLALAEQAMALRPRVALVAFYAGNDLADAYEMVYERGQRPALRSGDAPALAGPSLHEAWAQRWDRLHPPAPPPTPWQWVKRTSALLDLVRVIRDRSRPPSPTPRVFSPTTHDAGLVWPFSHGGVRTMLTAGMRLPVLDPADPRVALGHETSLRALVELTRVVRGGGASPLVVLVPTKELAFRAFVTSHAPAASIPPELVALWEVETRMWDRTRARLEAEQAPYFDLLPALAAQLASGVSPYFDDDDGHPNVVGCEVIARALAARPELAR
jgi:hypothetical protein